jgi:integrase
MELLQRDPTLAVTRPAPNILPPKGLTEDEEGKLLRVAAASSPRDLAIVVTLLWTAYRRAELAALTGRSISFEQRIVKGTPQVLVMATCRVKGGRIRRREIPRPAWEAIEEYFKAAGLTLDELGEGRIFGIGLYALSHIVQRLARRAGVVCTVHTLRHTAAKRRREHGASLAQIKKLMGHLRLSTTDRYLATVEGETDSGAHELQGELFRADRRKVATPVDVERRKPPHAIHPPAGRRTGRVSRN